VFVLLFNEYTLTIPRVSPDIPPIATFVPSGEMRTGAIILVGLVNKNLPPTGLYVLAVYVTVAVDVGWGKTMALVSSLFAPSVKLLRTGGTSMPFMVRNALGLLDTVLFVRILKMGNPILLESYVYTYGKLTVG
jgi:hypothetical protein